MVNFRSGRKPRTNIPGRTLIGLNLLHFVSWGSVQVGFEPRSTSVIQTFLNFSSVPPFCLVGSLTLNPGVEALSDLIGWRGAFQVCSGGLFVIGILVTLTFRPPPKKYTDMIAKMEHERLQQKLLRKASLASASNNKTAEGSIMAPPPMGAGTSTTQYQPIEHQKHTVKQYIKTFVRAFKAPGIVLWFMANIFMNLSLIFPFVNMVIANSLYISTSNMISVKRSRPGLWGHKGHDASRGSGQSLLWLAQKLDPLWCFELILGWNVCGKRRSTKNVLGMKGNIKLHCRPIQNTKKKMQWRPTGVSLTVNLTWLTRLSKGSTRSQRERRVNVFVFFSQSLWLNLEEKKRFTSALFNAYIWVCLQ